jgi:hypothetical protein
MKNKYIKSKRNYMKSITTEKIFRWGEMRESEFFSRREQGEAFPLMPSTFISITNLQSS